MEKTFILKDTHFAHNNIARYNTLDRRVDYVIFLKKIDWPNRVKEEVMKCGKCRSFILPRESKNHRMICKERPKETPNVENGNIAN